MLLRIIEYQDSSYADMYSSYDERGKRIQYLEADTTSYRQTIKEDKQEIKEKKVQNIILKVLLVVAIGMGIAY